jgi:phenolic acid decarboxylase
MTQTATDEPGYRGRTFRYELPNGWSFLMAFAADGTRLRMDGLTGPFTGQSLDLTISAVRVAPGVWFLNWIKPDGDSVSQVHDYRAGTVYAYWAAEEDGVRTGRATTGRLVEVDAA